MYYDLEINEYKTEDIPSLKRLWIETFHDEPELVNRFFELLPSMGKGFVAKSSGEIFGAAYVLNAELRRTDNSVVKLGYIYAVAVDKSARDNGIGAELTRACKRYCWQNNIDICCTLPAENSLYGWYRKVGGFAAANYCTYETVDAADEAVEINELYADEYSFRRIDILRGRNYVNFDYGYLLYQKALLKTYGGGFFACKDGIACGYLDGETLLIKEALNCCPEFIPALCRKLGVNNALIRHSSEDGEPFIAAYEAKHLPSDTIWNLALD